MKAPISIDYLEAPDSPIETLETLPPPPQQEKPIETETLPYSDTVDKIFLGYFKLTAYCSCRKCCGKWADCRPKDENGNDIVYGASGAKLIEGISVAVDPSVIPYGSMIEFDEHFYLAHDTGGGIKGLRIDVYYNSHERALQFGRVDTVPVYLIP